MRNYISKLNDRNLQRKRESGLTSYALYSVLGIILYKVAEQYPTIPLNKNFGEVLFLFTCVVNTIWSLVVIYSVYDLTLGHLSSTRLILKSSKNDKILESFLETGTYFLLPLILNGVTFYIQLFTLQKFDWYFFLVGLFFIVLLVFVFFFNRKDRKINQSYEVFEGTGNVGTDKDFVSVLAYIIGISVITISIYYCYIFETSITKTSVLIYGSLLFAIPLILLKIIDLREGDSFTKSLENLEYEINVRDLSDAEIRERLQKNYLGFLLSEWIDFNLKAFEDFQKEYETKSKYIENLKNELARIDAKCYPIEFKGRQSKIDKENLSLKNKSEKFFNEKLNEIETVWADRKLEPQERSELSKLYNKFKNEFSKYK